MDEALLSISPAGRGRLLKILITLEPHGIFGIQDKIVLFILTLSSHLYAKPCDKAAGSLKRRKLPKITKSKLN